MEIIMSNVPSAAIPRDLVDRVLDEVSRREGGYVNHRQGLRQRRHP
jgi:hypothetical protein